MRSFLAVCAFAIAMTPAAVWAQGEAVIESGTRVRIAESGTASRGVLRGMVVAKSADRIVLKLDAGGETVSIAVGRVSQLELSRGMKRRTGAGLGYGLLGGAGAGVLAGLLACKSARGCESSNTELNRPQVYALWFGVLGGAAGGVIGAIIGASTRSERWVIAPLGNLRVSARPDTHGGYALALSVRF